MLQVGYRVVCLALGDYNLAMCAGVGLADAYAVALRVLGMIHEKRVVHGDLRLPNFVLGLNPGSSPVMLIDFEVSTIGATDAQISNELQEFHRLFDGRFVCCMTFQCQPLLITDMSTYPFANLRMVICRCNCGRSLLPFIFKICCCIRCDRALFHLPCPFLD